MSTARPPHIHLRDDSSAAAAHPEVATPKVRQAGLGELSRSEGCASLTHGHPERNQNRIFIAK
jgi:hypothetical protein